MNQLLNKKEYYRTIKKKDNKTVLIVMIIALVLNVIGIMLGPASIIGLFACIICWVGYKTSLNKWWGMALAIIGGIQWVLVEVIGGIMPAAEILAGVYMFNIVSNLDKSYAEYLKTGSLPDMTGM